MEERELPELEKAISDIKDARDLARGLIKESRWDRQRAYRTTEASFSSYSRAKLNLLQSGMAEEDILPYEEKVVELLNEMKEEFEQGAQAK